MVYVQLLIDSSDLKIRRSLTIKLSIPKLEYLNSMTQHQDIRMYWHNITVVSCLEKKENNLNEKCARFFGESRAATAPKHLNDVLGQQRLSIVEEQLMHHFLLWSCFTNALWWFNRSTVLFFSDIWYFLPMSTYYQHQKTGLQLLTPFFPYDFKIVQYMYMLLKHSSNVNQIIS